jgi:pyruvate/2-oxoglutarate dehydrogenase complex dihydrolipoamide dehydrogenase (E3) component
MGTGRFAAVHAPAALEGREMATEQRYDAVVIGAGQAGGPLSTALAGMGRKTVLVERKHVGGTCINEGCTPSKTMYASARVAYIDARSRDYGIETGSEVVDMEAVRRRKQAIVDLFRDGSTRAVEAGGVDILMGEGSFVRPDAIEVRMASGETLTILAREFFINTGLRPSVPPIAGLTDVRFLDSTSVMELDSVPDHLLILGAGYVGLEFGQMFRRFGSRVTIVEQRGAVLGQEDPDVAAAVAKILQDDGIELLLDSTGRGVAAANDGAIRLTVDAPGGTRDLEGSHLLVAVGRRPNTEALNLDAAGVYTDSHGYVRVNERLETSQPHIWALGDAAGSPPFTHISYDDFRIVRDNLFHGARRTTRDRLVPYTVFIDPQLGRVGMTEAEAHRKSHHVGVATLPMSRVARATESGDQRGMIKAVVDTHTHQILGAAALGLEGGEIMAMFEIAMMGRLPYTALREGIFAHPTLAELMNNLFQGI